MIFKIRIIGIKGQDVQFVKAYRSVPFVSEYMLGEICLIVDKSYYDLGSNNMIIEFVNIEVSRSAKFEQIVDTFKKYNWEMME